MVGHGGGVLQRTSVLQIGCDPCRPEAVVADAGADPGRQRPSPHHEISISLGQGGPAEPSGATTDGPEQRSLGILGDPGLVQVGVEVRFERMMARHLVPLAALLPQPHPEPAVLHEHILNSHGQRRSDPREAVDHQPDQSPVTQPDRGGDVDAVQQLPSLERIQHRGLALAHAVRRPAHGRGRVVGDHLAGDQPVEQVA